MLHAVNCFFLTAPLKRCIQEKTKREAVSIRHSNIAIFVPHNGCPHQCSFCNQKEITGQSLQPHAEDVRSAVETARKSLGEKTRNAEIAFFGGSFTAIDREYMLELLDAASEFVKSGEFGGIRLSTRPDAISREILDILRSAGVTSIELGAQSMDEQVLLMNERGHTARDVRTASGLIHEYGFSLGLQMMTGLYGSSAEKDRYTAAMLAELKPDTMRIYPTVVMKGTRLYELYKSGQYLPPDAEQSVPLCAELLSFFESKGINVIRLGLHDSGSLRESMAAGAFYPSFRELCESRIMLENALKIISTQGISPGKIIVCINPKSISRFTGQKKSNIIKLGKMGYEIKIYTDDSLEKYEVVIDNTAELNYKRNDVIY